LLRFSVASARQTREARQAQWVNPEGATHTMCAVFGRHMDVPSKNSRCACGPDSFIVGRAVGRLSFGYFSLPFKEK
jgi:hypothetical protein